MATQPLIASPILSLRIPFVPVTLNQLRGRWSCGNEQWTWFKWIRNYVLIFAQLENVDAIQSMARARTKMRVEIDVYHSRLFDEDNLHGACKPIFDVLKSHNARCIGRAAKGKLCLHLELIYDDRPEFLESHIRQFKAKRKEQYTLIRISP